MDTKAVCIRANRFRQLHKAVLQLQITYTTGGIIMACFLVPAAEAVVTTVVPKSMEKKEVSDDRLAAQAEGNEEIGTGKVRFSEKLGWLNKMLWGGTALLAFEHLWHGEIVPYFPFLTAAAQGDTAGMLHEMATNGVLMAVLVTVVWIGMIAAASILEKKDNRLTAGEKEI
jgi:hypothetical protein